MKISLVLNTIGNKDIGHRDVEDTLPPTDFFAGQEQELIGKALAGNERINNRSVIVVSGIPMPCYTCKLRSRPRPVG